MTQFELWINNTKVDLKDNFPLSLNASIADIRKPDTRQTTYSKTITIPASKSNRELFSYIFELDTFITTSGTVNYVPDFNPNLKATAVALVDTVEIFNGICQLLQINITDNNDIEFEIVLTGLLTNLFKNIGDRLLSDLDFSDLNHDYTLDEIEASWSNTEGYVYPLIDYGYSQNVTDFRIENLYPAIFVKDYIDRIFSDAGCTYDSDFFNSAFFGKLIIPFTCANFKITNEEITDRKFRASRLTTDQTISIGPFNSNTVIVFNNDTTVPNFDNSNQYTTSGLGAGNFTVGTGLQGNYNFGCYFDLTATYTPAVPGVDVKPTQVVMANISFVKVDLLNNSTVLNSTQVKIKPSSGYPVNTTYETNPTYPNYFDYLNTGTGDIFFQSGAVDLEEGDRIGVVISLYYSKFSIDGAVFSNGLGSSVGGTWDTDELFIDSSNNIYDGTYQANINVGSYFYNEIANANYVEGLPINMNNAVPENIKQKDFLMSIVKMFNLYLEQDKDISNKFIIEPREDYYLPTNISANVIDLSDLLDISQPLEIEPMGGLDFKKYYFKYKEDRDYFNNQYLLKWGETYSEREVDITNDFIVEEKTTDVIFSPTPSVGSNSNDRVIPRIINIDLNGTTSPVTANPRILIYDGLKSTNQAWTITDSTGVNNYTEYPYAGMLDDPYSPTVSLDWEVPDEIYWTNIFGTITYTNKNLYNNYWKKFINEVTDKNSKIVRGWFDIRPYEYANLDFRKTYYFEREYFRLNRVIDYNPLNNALTQLEFVKINEGVTTSFDYEEATDVFQVDRVPRFSYPYTATNIAPSGVKSMISGNDNRIASGNDSYTVIGDGNTIGEWANHIFIQGDDNFVTGNSSGVTVIGDGNDIGGSNVVLINTYNKTIDSSDCTYINDRCVSGEGSVALITTSKAVTTSGNDDATTYLCDCTSAKIEFDLPPAADYGVGNKISIKKIDASGNVVNINADGSELIDGSATLTLTTQYDAPMLISDGANWWII